MPRRSVIRDEKAVSPVIATIIIVAVAIVMSIAVAYWVLGLAGTFTRYEKIEIMYAYANTNTTAGGWDIIAELRNTGTAAATINMILINGKPIPKENWASYIYVYGNGTWQAVTAEDDKIVTLDPGKTCKIKITIPSQGLNIGITFASGMSVEVTFHSAAGSDYPKVVVLP